MRIRLCGDVRAGGEIVYIPFNGRWSALFTILPASALFKGSVVSHEESNIHPIRERIQIKNKKYMVMCDSPGYRYMEQMGRMSC